MSMGKIEVSRATMESIEPPTAPSQNEPLMMMSTRPRWLAGISSSTAELIAAYSPPMPAPVRKRRMKNIQASVARPVPAVAAR